MFFFNLSPLEFFALLGVVSSIVVALYLLDRSRRKQVVPTLRFWQSTQQPAAAQRRRKIQQPWSLLLQLVSLALLLLAIAQLRWGSPVQTSRDHVLLLDTSAWMGARQGRGTLLDEAKSALKQYLRSLPASDRVMLVQADTLATPATGFETDRAKVARLITSARAGETALRFTEALQFAQRLQQSQGRRPGEIVYAGAGRVSGDVPAALPENLRVLPLRVDIENTGLREVGLRRLPQEPDAWEVFVAARNYGRTRVSAPVVLRFGKALVGSRRLDLLPGATVETTFELRTRAAGQLDVQLAVNDAFADDNHASLELPAMDAVAVAVYSDEPDLLRPLLAAHPQVKAEFFRVSQYPALPTAKLVICDRFVPRDLGTVPLALIAPPRERSPIPVRAVVSDAPLTGWHGEHPLGAGIRTKNVRLGSSEVFTPAPGDHVVAETGNGPVIVARDAKPPLVVLGFQPAQEALRYELAAPLLFANLLGWAAPEVLRADELRAASVGSTSVPLAEADTPVRVTGEDGRPVPYTRQGKTLRFWTPTPGLVRVQSGNRERVYSLTLPEVASAVWEPPAAVRRGVPRLSTFSSAARDLWPFLAALGGLGLILEWFLFGGARPVRSDGPASWVRRFTRSAGPQPVRRMS